MTRFKPRVRWILGGLALVFILAIPLTESYRDREAVKLAKEAAANSNPKEAVVQWRIARLLDLDNQQIATGLANFYLRQGQASEALKLSRKVKGESGSMLKIRAQLELGELEATTERLTSALSDSEAVETLQNANADQLALGKALYANGLPRSAERVLEKSKVENSERYLLLARINLSLLPQNRQKARGYLEKAAKLDPGNLEVHRLLRETYLLLEENNKAAHEERLIKQLD